MKKSLLLFLAILIFNHLFSQEEIKETWNNVIPPAPSTAALAKYADIPVNHYTGVPNIGVPIYELKGKNFSVPVGLSYHSSGVKVKEIASWVGLGWSLNAGGMISRVVRGKPDERSDGYWEKCDLIPNPNEDYSEFASWDPWGYEWYTDSIHNTAGWDMTTVGMMADGQWDLEPDMFYYNFLGQSGKFMIYDGKCYTIPHNKIKIEFIREQIGNLNIIGFNVITEDGIELTFGNSLNSVEYTYPNNTCIDGQIDNYTSAWYLTQIKAGNNDIMHFDYKIVIEKRDEITTRTENHLQNCEGDTYGATVTPIQSCIINQYSYTPKLKKIWAETGDSISFDSSDGRLDMKDFSGCILNKIKIRDGSFAVNFELEYDYFSSGSSYDSKRLKLLSLTKKSLDGIYKEIQSFDYDNSSIPKRSSYDEDHWGYNNDAGNSTGVPEYFDNYSKQLFPGADKESNPNVQDHGLLTKIVYPTGGYTQFLYESNDYGAVQSDEINELERIDTSFIFEVNCFTGEPNETLGDTKTFLIVSDIVQYAKVEASYYSDAPGEPIEGTIYKGSYYIGENEEYIKLNEGNNYFDITVSAHNKAVLKVTCSQHFPWMGYIKTNPTGGARIKKIIHRDGNPNTKDITKEYLYNYYEEDDRSAGVLIGHPPKYEMRKKLPKVGYLSHLPDINPFQYVMGLCYYIAVTSNNLFEISTSGGSHVCYKQVTEKIQSENEEGFTVFDYSYAKDNATYSFPFPGIESRDWRRGHLLKKRIFDKDNVLKYKEENEYEALLSKEEFNTIIIPCAKAGWVVAAPSQIDPAMDIDLEIFQYTAGTFQNSKSTKTTYFDNNDSIYIVENYSYDNPLHAKLTKIERNFNDKAFEEENFSYPYDYLYPECRDDYFDCLHDKDSTIKGCRLDKYICDSLAYENCYDIYAANLESSDYHEWMDSYYSCRKTCLGVSGYNPDDDNHCYYNEDEEKNTLEDCLDCCEGFLDHAAWLNSYYVDKFYTCHAEQAEICDITFNGCFDPNDFPCDEDLEDCKTSLSYSADDITKMHNKMIQGNVLNPVIEHRTYKTDLLNTYKDLTDASLTIFKEVSGYNHLYKPIRFLTFENNEPVSAQVFIESSTSQDNSFIYDNNYMKETGYIDLYNVFGNVLELHKPFEEHTSFIWAYDFKYPIAKLEGISYSELDVDQINTIKQLEYADDISEIDNINQTIRAAGFLPEGVTLSTFTYEPSVGQTSVTDPNGKSMYYDYDSFGRLSTIKDHNHNIIKHNDYRYVPLETPSMGNIQGPAEVVSGGIAIFSIAGVDGASKYTWTKPDDAEFIGDPYGKSVKIQFKCSGNVSVSVDSKIWCGPLSKSKTVSILPPELAVLQPTEILCNTIQTLTVRNVDDLTNIYWSSAGDATIISENDSTIDYQFTGPGSISVYASSDKWCWDSDTTYITNDPVPVVNSLTGTSLIDMSNFSSETYIVDGPCVTYEWVLDPGLGNCIESSISEDGKVLTLDRNQNPFCFFPNPLTIKVRATDGTTTTNWVTKTVTIQN